MWRLAEGDDDVVLLHPEAGLCRHDVLLKVRPDKPVVPWSLVSFSFDAA